jgi:hypothetical protein
VVVLLHLELMKGYGLDFVLEGMPSKIYYLAANLAF